MVRLLWHCCGHLYYKHWDQLGALNLRPQFGLVLAHIAKILKLYGLIDSKEMASLDHTVQLVRPPTMTVQKVRPSKRQGTAVYPDKDDLHDESGQKNRSMEQQPKTNSFGSEKKSISSMKSGSWGGQTVEKLTMDPSSIGNRPAAIPNFFAQTC